MSFLDKLKALFASAAPQPSQDESQQKSADEIKQDQQPQEVVSEQPEEVDQSVEPEQPQL